MSTQKIYTTRGADNLLQYGGPGSLYRLRVGRIEQPDPVALWLSVDDDGDMVAHIEQGEDGSCTLAPWHFFKLDPLTNADALAEWLESSAAAALAAAFFGGLNAFGGRPYDYPPEDAINAALQALPLYYCEEAAA